MTGFTAAGVTLGGTAGATTATVTGSGTTYNVAVTGMTQSGTVTASILAGAASSNGTFNTASTSTDNTVTYDITSPSVTINQAASQSDPAGASPINFTAVFSEAVTGFTGSSVTLGGTAGATTAAVTGSGSTYNVAVSGMTQSGTVTASIGAGNGTDLAGNPNTASTSTDNSVTYNAQSGLVASYSFEENTGTTTADSSGNNNTGTLSSGVAWTTGKVGNAVSFNGTAGDITVTDAPSLDFTGSFTLAGWVNPATVSGTQTVMIKETTSGCAYFLQIVNGQIDSGFNNGTGCIEHVTTTANLVAGNWYYITVVLDHSNNVYNTYLNGSLLTSVAETGVPVPNNQTLLLGRSGYSAGNFERLNGVLDEVRIYSRALSATEIQQAYSASSGPTPTITSLSPTSGVVGTSVVITGTNFGATQGTSTVTFNGTISTPTAWTATSITAPVPTGATTGIVIVTVGGVASNGVNFTVTSAPSVTINQAASQADPTSASPINFAAVFSTAVTGFTASGVTLGGTAGATTATVTGSGTTYNVAVTGMTQSGTVTVSILAGAASSNGTFNTASTSTDNTVTYDITSPSVTINQAASQSDPAGASPINFTAVFSEAVTGFTGSDVTLGGTAGATTATVTGSGSTYNVAVSGMTQSGTVTASIGAGTVTDLAGNPNTASTSTDNSVTYNAQSGLVASYSFEENTGTTTADSSGNNNTGTLSSGVAWTTGKVGNAVSFNGTAGDITIADSSSLDFAGSFTLSGWVQPATVSGFQTILIKETTSGCAYFLQIVNGQVDSGFNNGTGCIEHVTTTANLVAGDWYYITVVLDHSNNVYNTYLNGNLLTSVAESGVPVPNNQTLLLGRSGCSSCGFERLNGVLDEVRIYSRALSATEIQQAYSASSGPTPTITSLNPTSGVVGTSVVITGTNFGATQGTSTVTFNGTISTPTAWTATSITAPVPSGATTGNVVVTVAGVPSNGVSFAVTVPPPNITTLSPTSGPVGTSVLITGTAFGAAQGTSTVKFNGVSSTPTTWSATSISTPVPTGATTGSVVVTVGGVASNGVGFSVTSLTVAVSPRRAAVTLSQQQQFTGTVTNDPLNGGVSWSVDGVGGGSAASGTVSASGLYTPGTQPGVHTVTATSNSNTLASASATAAVTDLAGVFTYHNDTARTGQNLKEYALTTATVNSSTFGALFTCGGLDGYLYAAPLYVANLNVGGKTRNVVFLASEHDSVYAYDADSPACLQLWQKSFLSTNVTTVAPSDVNELVDLIPEIGITSTPVIDPSTNTIYVMAKTKETAGTVSGNVCSTRLSLLRAPAACNGSDYGSGEVRRPGRRHSSEFCLFNSSPAAGIVAEQRYRLCGDRFARR